MRIASIRELKNETTTVLGWVAEGQRVEVQRHGKPVAVLSAPDRPKRTLHRPDFAARLRAIYGDQAMGVTATDLLQAERGDR